MECVTTVTHSISINGGIHGYIVGCRDLHQGDLMSPSLFIICLEYLSRLLAYRTTHTVFNFHPVVNTGG